VGGVNSVVSLRNFAKTSNVPIVVFADLQQESGAAPRLEARCPSMLIDALPRSHKVTYLWDASARPALEDVSADAIHRAVSKISGLYADVYGTDDWIASTLPRKLGIGKNAGG
jgi:hypothetical protein